jgi:hypothetical protein
MQDSSHSVKTGSLNFSSRELESENRQNLGTAEDLIILILLSPLQHTMYMHAP